MPEGVPGQVLALMLTRDINFKEKMSLSPHYPGSLTVYVKKIKGLFPCTPMSSGRIQTAWNQYSSSDQFILNCWSSQELGLTGCQWPHWARMSCPSKLCQSTRGIWSEQFLHVWSISRILFHLQFTRGHDFFPWRVVLMFWMEAFSLFVSRTQVPFSYGFISLFLK